MNQLNPKLLALKDTTITVQIETTDAYSWLEETSCLALVEEINQWASAREIIMVAIHPLALTITPAANQTWIITSQRQKSFNAQGYYGPTETGPFYSIEDAMTAIFTGTASL